MSKKKRYYKEIHDDKYYEVADAISYILYLKEQEEIEEAAKIKGGKILTWIISILLLIFMSLNFISTYNFNFDWLSNIKLIYNEFYLGGFSYVVITSLVFCLNNRFGILRKSWFYYFWPLIAFIVTTFISNTVTVGFAGLSPRTNLAGFCIALIISAFLMKSVRSTLKRMPNSKANKIENALKLLDENEDIVKEVLTDFKNDIAKDKHSSQ